MTLTKTLFFSLIALCFTYAFAANFDIVNHCPNTVWPAGIPGIGGRQLNSGQTWSLNVPGGTKSARIWARTGCNFDGSGHGGCSTGDCGGVINCQLSGQPPATLAEFTLNGDGINDYYDISVIDGFNIGMQFAPTSNGCSTLTCTDPSCPDAYHQPNDVKTFACRTGTNYRIVFCP